MQQPQASFLFDLDGTLVDSVYQQVLAWNEALDAEGIKRSVWRIHRKIGMSGGLLTNMLLRETGLVIDADRIERLQRLHAQAYIRLSAKIFFLTVADRVGSEIETASVVGDSVWDMLAARRARALGIGLLCGGYGQEELERAGAYRVYEDLADLLNHIDEMGGRH
jgi:phosphoglycolate phosphatase-like HAD superfamily hydrolase